MPNMTHWGLSISIGRASSSSSSGKTGASLSTVVNRLTVETVTRSRNAVSTSEHLLTGLQCRIEVPRGMRMAARAQSTMAWWKRRPWLHLRWKCFLLWLMMTVQQLIDDIWIFKHDGTGLSKFENTGCFIVKDALILPWNLKIKMKHPANYILIDWSYTPAKELVRIIVFAW